MSLTALAPSEKAEHLIYAILPASAAFALVSYLEIDNLSGLGLISVAMTLLTLLLYEIRGDESFVKRMYSRLPDSARIKLGRWFFGWSCYFEMWEDIYIVPPELAGGAGSMENQVQKYVENTVSSQPVRRRLWPVRATIYLLFSVPLIVFGGLISWSRRVNSFSLFGIEVQPLPFGELLSWLITLSLVLWAIIGLVNYYRYRDLRLHIHLFAVYRFALDLLALHQMRKPRLYLETEPTGQELRNLRRLLEFLQERVSLGEWTSFIDTWIPYREYVEARGVDSLERFFLSTLYSKWDIYSSEQQKQRTIPPTSRKEREYAWYIHHLFFFVENYLSEENPSRKIVEFINRLYLDDTGYNSVKPSFWKQIEIELRRQKIEPSFSGFHGLANPMYILSRVPDEILNGSAGGIFSAFRVELMKLMMNSLSGKIDRNSWESMHTELSVSNDSEACFKLAMKIVRIEYEKEIETTTWQLPLHYYQTGFLRALNQRVLKSKAQNEWQHVMALILNSADDDVLMLILEDSEWHSYLSSVLVRKELQRIEDGQTTRNEKVVALVKNLRTLSAPP